jgi:alkylhydroperoxidase family enzyme
MTEPSIPRIEMLDVADARERANTAGVPGALAELTIFRALLTEPKLARPLSDLLTALLFKGRLAPRVRELVIMRVGWCTASVYEWTQHWRVATELGVPADDLLGVRDWATHAAFDQRERAALAAVDDVVDHGSISEDRWAELTAAFPRDELLELTAVVATWHCTSMLLRSLDIPLEDGVEAWPPDGIVLPSAR